MFPESLLKIAKFLRYHEHLPIVRGGSDGRSDSEASENKIVSILLNEKEFNIESKNIGRGSNRCWYDFIVDEKYYVDLKVSKLGRQADNTNAKKAIYYTLTGLDAASVSDREDDFFNQLKQYKEENICDFYYVIVGKEEEPGEPKRAFFFSFRTLKKVRPNRKNQPFQCIWEDCIKPQKRNYTEASHFLLNYWSLSIKKDIEKLNSGMPTAFPEYFKTADG